MDVYLQSVCVQLNVTSIHPNGRKSIKVTTYNVFSFTGILCRQVKFIMLSLETLDKGALTPLLSTPLASDNCRQIHMWRVRGFPLGSPLEGR